VRHDDAFWAVLSVQRWYSAFQAPFSSASAEPSPEPSPEPGDRRDAGALHAGRATTTAACNPSATTGKTG